MKKEVNTYQTLVEPPIGLRPKFISDELRLNEVRAAMSRYFDAKIVLPIEWIEEYNDLTERLK